MSRSYGRCIGYDDTIALFREVANYISDNDMADDELAEQYTYAMNRLEYERDKSVGAETRKIPKRKGTAIGKSAEIALAVFHRIINSVHVADLG